MKQLQFEFVAKARSEDPRTTVIGITSITDMDENDFLIPEQFQWVKLHPLISNTKVFRRVRNTLLKRHDKRREWISVTPDIRDRYLDEDGNVQFQGCQLEKVTKYTNKKIVEVNKNMDKSSLMDRSATVEAMDAVEVDVQLFIKCRMCLDQQGVYQIAPNMIHIIKFCFDIDIELFDGLPQLICKSCKFILTEYNQIKKSFQEKQKALKEKLCNREKLPVSAPEKSSHDAASEKAVLPDETAVVAPLSPPEDAPLETALPAHNRGWKSAYQQHFVCVFCNKTYLRLSSVRRHVKRHRKFVNRHIKVFRNYCSVQLNKIDSKLNITGSLDVVVYNHEKIIANTCNYSFRKYFEKKPIVVQSPYETSIEKAVSVSSNEEIGKGKKKRKSHFSSSSTETTILEADCGTSNNVPESNAPRGAAGPRPPAGARAGDEDAASACPPTNKIVGSLNLRQRKLTKPTINNYKTIQSIVAMCNKKLKKKILSDNEIINNKPKICESSLKRKVLSLGRKVINNKGFGCTGLLRYMEHKELAITWQPVTKEYQNKVSNFVRIMPKMKPREGLENDNAGWKDLEVISYLEKQDISDEINEDEPNVPEIPTITDNEENIPCSSVKIKEDVSNRILHINAANDLFYNNKLQNKTPVANLKKVVAETRPLTVFPNESTECRPIDVNSELENDEVQNGTSFMPIITSARSLAINNEEDNNKPIVFKGKPLIKVKPVSELMPERSSSNQNTSENVWTSNHIVFPCHLTNSLVYAAAPMSHSQVDEINHPASEVSNAENNISPMDRNNGTNAKNLEFVTLDTLELPNTKTRTPFQYFKMVLLYHGLGLLELNEELPDHYNCLVKFKLELRQDNKQPLGLLLSLFCSNNSFCFHFKDSKLKKFDPNQLPAFWQWELLKIYKGDVVKKVLLNAAKIGKEVYENTDTFLCLLKSINLIT